MNITERYSCQSECGKLWIIAWQFHNTTLKIKTESPLKIDQHTYPCQNTWIHSYYFRQTLHGFSSDCNGTLTEHSQNLYKRDSKRQRVMTANATESLPHIYLKSILLPVINKCQSSVQTASWRPDI